MIESSDWILNILWVIDLSLILFNTSWGIYSIPKESKYAAVFLSINNESRCFFLLYLSLRFMTYTLSFIFVNCLKRTIKLMLVIKMLNNPNIAYYYLSVLLYPLPCLLNPFPTTSSLKVMLITEEFHLLVLFWFSRLFL